jgi:hypothetical protein
MLHARKLAFRAGGISLAEISGDDESQHRVAEKFERFVMELTRLVLGSGRDLFVRPRAMRDSPFQQGTVLKLVTEDRFQAVEIRKINSLRFQGGLIETSRKHRRINATSFRL